MMFKNALYHPYEIRFAGSSGSGKTTLIQKLIAKLSMKYRLGYAKHASHDIAIDTKGKDSELMATAGAMRVLLNSPQTIATYGAREFSPQDKLEMLDADWIFVEGHKATKGDKVLVVGPDENPSEIAERIRGDEKGSVIAIAGETSEMPKAFENLPGNPPYIHRDDIDGWLAFCEQRVAGFSADRPLKALILAGGRSKRMGEDKGALNYHGKSQVARVHELLTPLVDEVYVSCRADQTNEDHLRDFPQLHDKFLDMGPMGGILSAFDLDASASWLVVACDLPFINSDTLNMLLGKRDRLKAASCFINPTRGWPEPLCTVWEPKSAAVLYQLLAVGYRCPRKVLMNTAIEALDLENLNALDNANTPEEYAAFKEALTA